MEKGPTKNKLNMYLENIYDVFYFVIQYHTIKYNNEYDIYAEIGESSDW
jgi:hypothetical protein